jgi:hypothetical protein
MKYLLTNKSSYQSARLLATRLGLKVTTDLNKLDEPPVIRFGNSSKMFEEDTNLNSPVAIQIVGNSLNFTNWCKDNDVRCAEYIPYSQVKEFEYPFYIRSLHHHQGRDIVIVNNEEEHSNINVPRNKFYVKYIPTDFEITIHVINGEVIKLFKKINGNNENIRSSIHGWKFYRISDLENNFQIAQSLVTSVFQKVGLMFGRADVGYNKETKTYHLFEINSSPSLSSNENTLTMYANRLRELIHEEFV